MSKTYLNKTRYKNKAQVMKYNGALISGMYYNSGLDIQFSVEETPIDYSTEYFTIESLEDGNTITLTIGSNVTTTSLTSVSWSKDKTTWNTTNNNSSTVTINVNANAGEKIYWKGSGVSYFATSYSTNNNYRSKFAGTKTFNILGNIASLLFSDNFIGQTTVPAAPSDSGGRNFEKLFMESYNLINAENLVLPFTTLQKDCYGYMFHTCTSLLTAPKLIAQETKGWCYDCMFRNCSSLVEAPILYAATLTQACYAHMFNGCSRLNKITCLATNISATECCVGWTTNVSSTGTFIKAASMTSWPTGINGIPRDWTVQDYVA